MSQQLELKEGTLVKKGMGSFFRTWKERRFVLRSDFTLSYFDNKDVEKGCLTLDGASVRAIPPTSADGRAHAFEIYDLPEENGKKAKSLILQAKSDQESMEWIDAVRKCLADQRENEAELEKGRISLTNSPTAYLMAEELADQRLKAAKIIEEEHRYEPSSSTKAKNARIESMKLKEEGYAIRLQCRWRMHRARKYVEALRLAEEERIAQIKARRALIEIGAALLIQCSFRRAKAIKKVAGLRANKAAKVIAMSLRGYTCGRKFRALKGKMLSSMGLSIKVHGSDGENINALIAVLSPDTDLADYSRQGFEGAEGKIYERESDPNGHSIIALQKSLSVAVGDDAVRPLSWREPSIDVSALTPDSIISSITSNGSIVITLFCGDGYDKCYGQVVLNMADHLDVYDDGWKVIDEIPLIEYVHKVQWFNGKSIIPKATEVKGYISLYMQMPPLHQNMCGWLMKKSVGTFSYGKWKKKWIVLSGDKIWHYASPWHMNHVKGCILCNNVTEFHQSREGTTFWLSFTGVKGTYGDKKVSKDGGDIWEMQWDPDSDEETKNAWRRKFVSACPQLLHADLSKNGLVPRPNVKKQGFFG